ncbi:hypothetical protein TPHA_0J01140 [Tetrapisispora phaffii CBS 4417]|uniref:Conserved oligomeric Golgi complex subunit 4 n=1 Tax=Tetrapisispora phaffii (strain ATCC 24235 / CBS 4417 / NBRC 1672 / NRRL Y-8282 / UCD 70-5) TaxID=1071381 RepID=G8BYJ4_TETPH|nr:hypothetical protein TPHA_0J01140 [Tetrapisispora phaffii CBS 4417]CCE64936.1 hypothetical protein TPHA_0J01140 [Tetrapisispora phaffii CBS 4417]
MSELYLDSNDNEISWDNAVLEGLLSKELSKYNQLFSKLSTQSQLNKLHDIIQRDKAETTGQLNKFIATSQFSHNKKIRKLELLRTNLTTVLTNYNISLANVSSSNNIAKSINYDISTIDTEKNLVNKILEFLNYIRLLKNNISLINNALKDENYVVAATAIEEIRKIPENVIKSEFASRVVPSSEVSDEPTVVINKWSDELKEIFQKRFMKAAESSDTEELTLMFKMFPMIGQDKLGLDMYSKYVCNIIAEESRTLMTINGNDNLEQSIKRPGFFSQVLLHLFKLVSTVINEHSKVITVSYNLTYMTNVMEKVEKEAELQAGLVLDTFAESKKLTRTVKEIKEWQRLQMKKNNRKLNGDSSDSEDSDAESMDGVQMISVNNISLLINEFSQILQNWSMYTRFFSVRWNEFNDIKYTKLDYAPSLLESNFKNKLVNEGFISTFDTLVLYHLHKSFNNSIELEEMPDINNLVTLRNTVPKHKEVSSYAITSVLEDITLLVRKNLVVVVNTGQFDILSRFLDQLVRFIQNEYLVRFLQNKFKNLQPKLIPSLALKEYIPKEELTNIGHHNSKLMTPVSSSTKLSKLGFDLRGAAANALTNIQSNIQSVVSDPESVLSLHNYLIYVNTLYLNVVFTQKILVKEILENNPTMLSDNFPFGEDSELLTAKINACNELVKKQNEKLQKWSLKYLFENVLKNKISVLCKDLFVNGNDNTYISSTDDFEDLTSINDFILKWKALIIPYKNVLYDDAFIELLNNIVNYIVTLVDKKIWSLRVNDLGATKLDRELSLYISTICDTNYLLREKFISITQMVLVLGFDDDDFDTETNDVKEEIANGINWVLTSKDRIRTRNLKVDKRQ